MKRKQYSFGDLDSESERVDAMIDLENRFANEIEALDAEIESLRKKKPKKGKGFAMKNILVLIAILSILVGSAVYGQYVKSDVSYDIVSNPDTLTTFLRDVVGAGTFEFTPIAAPSGNDIIEGKMYYDSSANTFYGSKDGSNWTEFATGGATSLDAAYNVGNTIDVDTSAVTMTTSDGDNNVVLAIVQDEATSDNVAMTITSGTGATGTGLVINSQSTGTDIAGDNWSVDQAGKLTILEVFATGDFLFTGTTYDVAFDASREGFVFEDNSILGFGAATHDDAPDITYSFDSTGSDLNITFDDLEIAYGSDGAGGDVFWYVETASTWVKMSEANDQMELELADLHLSSDTQIELENDAGTVDWTIDNATDETLLFYPTQTSDDQSINLGNATNTTDLRIFGLNASTVVFDASADVVLFDVYNIALGDGDQLLLGDTLGTGDFSISDESDVLLITQVSDGVGAVAFSADGEGMDVVFHTDTASSSITVDENGRTNGSMVFEAADLHMMDGDFVVFGDGADITMTSSTPKQLLIVGVNTDETDEVHIGVNSAGIDLSLHGTTSGDILLWDASDDYLHMIGDKVLFTLAEAGAANVFKVDCTGAAGSEIDLIVLETSDGGIQLLADGDDEGDIDIDAEDHITITAGDTLTVTAAVTTFATLTTFTVGPQSTPLDRTANTASQAGSLITAGTRIVEITAVTVNADDWVVLPVGVLGERVTIIATVACELRTIGASDDEINEVDSDGTQEYQLTAGDIVDLICVEAGARWTAVSHTILGAAKTIVPD